MNYLTSTLEKLKLIEKVNIDSSREGVMEMSNNVDSKKQTEEKVTTTISSNETNHALEEKNTNISNIRRDRRDDIKPNKINTKKDAFNNIDRVQEINEIYK